MSESSRPPLPEVPALANDDSMLTRRFGKEVVNYYAGSRLNRYSFLRPDTTFLRRAAVAPEATYVALSGLSPFVVDPSRLAHFSFDDVKPLIGAEPFRLTEKETEEQFDSSKPDALVVFLGMLDDGSSQLETPTANHGVVKGTPYFAVDVTGKGPLGAAAEEFAKKAEERGFSTQRDARAMTLQSEIAAIYGQARSMIDWNTRNGFCAGCGLPNLSTHAGYKRVCPVADAATPDSPRGDCPTRHGVSNVCFPRTDPTMIAAVVSADGQRVLLGRQSRWPPYFFSTLAGFVEPGESIEEAVRREVWEESGVRVGRVVVHSTQPWPYPSSLMIGAIAQALPGDGETVNLNDKELETARWFTLDELRRALKSNVSSLGAGPPEGYKEGDVRLPPEQAIANQLMTAVAEGYLTGIAKM